METVVIVLAILNVLFLAYHFMYVLQTNKQLTKMVKAIMAKDLPEYDHSENIDKNKDSNNPVDDIPEFIPAEDATDEEFDKIISNLSGKIN